jgi:hypothetical protein
MTMPDTVPDPIAPPGGGGPVYLTSQKIYEELRQYQHLGVLEYVLPTDPLGEQWILGVKGQIVKLTGDDQAAAFLAGCSAVAHWAHAQMTRRNEPMTEPMTEAIMRASRAANAAGLADGPAAPFETGDRPRGHAEMAWDASRGDEL